MTFWKKCECGEWFLARNGDRGRPRICCEKCHKAARTIAMAELMRQKRSGGKARFSSEDGLAELRRRQRAEERARLAESAFEHTVWRGQNRMWGSVK